MARTQKIVRASDDFKRTAEVAIDVDLKNWYVNLYSWPTPVRRSWEATLKYQDYDEALKVADLWCDAGCYTPV